MKTTPELNKLGITQEILDDMIIRANLTSMSIKDVAKLVITAWKNNEKEIPTYIGLLLAQEVLK